MKPFDLEKAKAGAPVITRGGNKCVFGAYNPAALLAHQVFVWVDGCPRTYFSDGKMFSDHDGEHDLFMLQVKHRREVFTNSEGIVIDYYPDGKPPPSDLWKRAIIEWEE